MYPIASPYFEGQNHDHTLIVHAKGRSITFPECKYSIFNVQYNNIILVRQKYISLVVNSLRKQRHLYPVGSVVNDSASF